MSQKSLSNWLKIIIVLMAICGIVVYAYAFPELIASLVPTIAKDSTEKFASMGLYFEWMIIFWISAIPCYIVLILGWFIACNIGKDKSFTVANAKYLKYIMIVTLIDCIYFFIANVMMFSNGKSTELIFVVSLVAIFAGIVFAVTVACLSHLVLKAAKLQEESDLTI